MRIAIIGGGVAGLTCAQVLRAKHDVTIFEKESNVGGLIRCERVNGSLFHICGGHVFNSHNQRVLDWFWKRFDKERDFVRADRWSAVCLPDGSFVDYPIENHVYQLPRKIQEDFHADLELMMRHPEDEYANFGDFLLKRFGKTLYDLYFKPYNMKVWRCDLSRVPLSWLDGKLPMPTPQEMREANENHLEEKSFVHSSFYYAKRGGSQFIIDTLRKGVVAKTSWAVSKVNRREKLWMVDGESYDKVIFAANLKDLPGMIDGVDIGGYEDEIEALESHGTTAVFCETDTIPYSWFYQPSPRHDSHRFICTGNFSPTNNAPGKMTCTVEFTDKIEIEEMKRQLLLMPYNPRYMAHHYSKYSYPIQNLGTRNMVQSLKERLEKCDLYLCGRFAEWEYLNMDMAMASALNVCDKVVCS